jgi:hypothetical protein
MAGLKWVGGGQEGEGMVGCSDRSRMRGEGERSLGSVYVGLLGLDLVCKDRLLKKSSFENILYFQRLAS